MNYNTYNPMMYSNVYGVPQNTQYQYQQPYTTAMQTQPQGKPFVDEVRIMSEDEAKSYIVDANKSAMLIDSEKQVFRIKSADAFGKSTSQLYEYRMIDDNSTKLKTPEIDTSNFVTKDDLSGFVTTDKLKDALKGLECSTGKKIDELKRSMIMKLTKEESIYE